jgi:hypothetical protein
MIQNSINTTNTLKMDHKKRKRVVHITVEFKNTSFKNLYPEFSFDDLMMYSIRTEKMKSCLPADSKTYF